MRSIIQASTVVYFLALASCASAFVAPSKSRFNTELYRTTKDPPPLPPITEVSYGEESRRYRRTVYTHEDWVKFRSPDRFWRNIRSMFVSGVYKNIGKEVTATVAIATVIVIWNSICSGYTDFAGIKHDALIQDNLLPLLSLPLTPFTLSSPALGLLLGKCC